MPLTAGRSLVGAALIQHNPVVCQNSADAISGVIEHPEHREIGDLASGNQPVDAREGPISPGFQKSLYRSLADVLYGTQSETNLASIYLEV